MKKIYLISVLIVLMSCNVTKQNSQKSSLFSILKSSSYHGKDAESNMIISNQKELETLYKSVEEEHVPKIDFSKSQVIVLFLGMKNTGGYSILVDRVEEKDGKIIIYKKVEIFKGMATMAITNPFVIVEIHSKKEIVFK